MRYKASKLISNTNILENNIIQVLHVYERYDANVQQVWIGVNKDRTIKKPYGIEKIKKALISLADRGIIGVKEYKGGLFHYVLKEYLLDNERSMYV